MRISILYFSGTGNTKTIAIGYLRSKIFHSKINGTKTAAFFVHVASTIAQSMQLAIKARKSNPTGFIMKSYFNWEAI